MKAYMLGIYLLELQINTKYTLIIKEIHICLAQEENKNEK